MKLSKLQKGDTIGIICPASSISKTSPRISAMEKYLISLGFNIKYGDSFRANYGYLAGDDYLRANDLKQMFINPDVGAIICMLGGFGCSRIVDLIDYQVIQNNPKLFIGFSDITVLLNAINQKTRIPTIHGVVGIYLGNPNMDLFSYQDFETLIFEKQKGRILENPNSQCETLIGGRVTGELVGGNLSLINTLIGTPYEIDFTDKIVFIEEVDEAPYRIDRYFSTLRLNKTLEKAKGFVFGYFTNCDPKEENSWTPLDIIKQYFKKLNKPTIYNFASGHNFPFINLPIGLKVELDANKKTIKILEELYESN